jgi:hypothetical protein
MKKILLMLALIFICTSANAEWSNIGESEDKGGYTTYADIDTIHSYQGKVKMWSLLDFKVEQKTPGTHFLSKRIRREYDCNGAYIRTLAFKLYSWNMEQGKLVRSYNQPRNWEKIEANSMDEIEWKLACDNR